MRTLVWVLACLAAGAAAAVLAAEPEEAPVHPADVIVACAADVTSAVEVAPGVVQPAIDPETAKTVRYIWLDCDPENRAGWARIIDGHLNLLSLKGALKPAVRVGDWLLRIDAADYGPVFRKQWERLGRQDWVFHDTAFDVSEEYEEVEVEYGYWTRPGHPNRPGGGRKFPDETWVVTRREKEKRAKPKAVRGLAPWLVPDDRAKRAMETLQGKTGGTDVPVVAASQFLWATAIQDDRDPGYCDFLGYKDIKEYERIIGVVRKDIDPERLREARAVTGNSTVTKENVLRRIIHLSGVNSDYWLTADANQEKVEDRQRDNPLFNFGDDYKPQAFEAFGNLPNGLPATGLFNAAGERQNTAPPFIASDDTGVYRDTQVHVNLSCIRCHSERGMKDVHDWVRSGLNRFPNYLTGKTPEERRKLQDHYVNNRLEPYLESFRERADVAIREAAGAGWKDFSAAYGKAWAEVVAPVTPEVAARRLGTTTENYLATLKKMDLKGHPNLDLHRQEPPIPVPLVSYAQAYPFVQYALQGKQKPYKVEVKEKR